MSTRSRVARISILTAWMVVCFLQDGTRGMFYGFLLFGILAFAWYSIIDTWHRFSEAMGAAVRRPNVTVDSRSVNIYTEGEQARRGVPVTTEDFAGMIEYRKNT